MLLDDPLSSPHITTRNTPKKQKNLPDILENTSPHAVREGEAGQLQKAMEQNKGDQNLVDSGEMTCNVVKHADGEVMPCKEMAVTDKEDIELIEGCGMAGRCVDEEIRDNAVEAGVTEDTEIGKGNGKTLGANKDTEVDKDSVTSMTNVHEAKDHTELADNVDEMASVGSGECNVQDKKTPRQHEDEEMELDHGGSQQCRATECHVQADIRQQECCNRNGERVPAEVELEEKYVEPSGKADGGGLCANEQSDAEAETLKKTRVNISCEVDDGKTAGEYVTGAVQIQETESKAAVESGHSDVVSCMECIKESVDSLESKVGVAESEDTCEDTSKPERSNTPQPQNKSEPFSAKHDVPVDNEDPAHQEPPQDSDEVFYTPQVTTGHPPPPYSTDHYMKRFSSGSSSVIEKIRTASGNTAGSDALAFSPQSLCSYKSEPLPSTVSPYSDSPQRRDTPEAGKKIQDTPDIGKRSTPKSQTPPLKGGKRVSNVTPRSGMHYTPSPLTKPEPSQIGTKRASSGIVSSSKLGDSDRKVNKPGTKAAKSPVNSGKKTKSEKVKSPAAANKDKTSAIESGRKPASVGMGSPVKSIRKSEGIHPVSSVKSTKKSSSLKTQSPLKDARKSDKMDVSCPANSKENKSLYPKSPLDNFSDKGKTKSPQTRKSFVNASKSDVNASKDKAKSSRTSISEKKDVNSVLKSPKAAVNSRKSSDCHSSKGNITQSPPHCNRASITAVTPGVPVKPFKPTECVVTPKAPFHPSTSRTGFQSTPKPTSCTPKQATAVNKVTPINVVKPSLFSSTSKSAGVVRYGQTDRHKEVSFQQNKENCLDDSLQVRMRFFTHIIYCKVEHKRNVLSEQL